MGLLYSYFDIIAGDADTGYEVRKSLVRLDGVDNISETTIEDATGKKFKVTELLYDSGNIITVDLPLKRFVNQITELESDMLIVAKNNSENT